MYVLQSIYNLCISIQTDIPIYIYTVVECMGKITININDDLERKVRIKIAKNGGKKGDLTKAIEAGLSLWLKEN